MSNLSITPRVDVATIDKVLNKATEPIMRSRPIIAMYRKKGRIKTDYSGKTLKWNAKYKRNDGDDYDDLEGTTAERVNRHKQAELGWGAYRMTEGISRIETLINSGPEAIFSVAGDMIDSMKGDLVAGLEKRLIKGSGTYTDTKIFGFEDCLAEDAAIGTTIGFDANDTYAGLTTTLGDYGGTATSFPYGECDETATFWTPILVDSTSTNLAADEKTWKSNWKEICTYMISGLQTMQSKTFDMIAVTPTMYREMKESLSDETQLNIDRGAGGSLVAEMGFTAVHVDGVPIVSAYGLPADTGYGLCFDELELISLQKDLFHKADQEDLFTYTKALDILFAGQQKITSPAFIGQIYTQT